MSLIRKALALSVGAILAVGHGMARTQDAVPARPAPAAGAARVPDSVLGALKAASIPASALGATVVALSGTGLSLAVNDSVPMNPASTMKLVTTLAALELLGPQFTWRTTALATAPLREGTLEGDLYLRGSGDPQFVIENLWLLVQRLRGLGLRDISGDLVIDRSAFAAVAHDPAAFDGEALRPYNAGPEGLLLNFKSVSFHFVPLPETRQVRVYAIPAVAGMTVPTTVRAAEGPCNDWRARTGGDFSDPLRPQFRGVFPLACGEQVWHVSLLANPQYIGGVFRQLWETSGGTWTGRVRDAAAPVDARRLAHHDSRSLAEVMRDINKFSNNVMARQLFLTLGTAGASGSDALRQGASAERAQRVVGDWLVGKGLARNEFVLENGAGLSRIERLTTSGLARLLVGAWGSPLMPEFASSLPLVGVDGTMRKRLGAAGSAHIKTGLLADTSAVAGYVLAASGRRYAVVAFVNHPNASAGQTALDTLLNWVYVNG